MFVLPDRSPAPAVQRAVAKPQPRERAWDKSAGKEDPVELDSSPTLRNDLGGVA